MIEKEKQFRNIGRDEDGNMIGNCVNCCLNGVKIINHSCINGDSNGNRDIT